MSKSSLRLFMIFIVILLTVSLACNLPGRLQAPEEPRPEGEEQVAPAESDNQSPTQAITAEQPESTPTEASTTPGSSRSNPASGTELHKIEGWEIQVKEYLRGEAAWEFLQKEGPSNIVKIPGWDYVVVKLYVRNTFTEKDVQSPSLKELTVTGDRKVLYQDNFWGSPAPEILYEDIFTGESMEGWIDALIPADEMNLMVAFERESTDDPPRSPFYIALEPGAAVDTALPAPLTPTDVGKNPDSPAPLGSTVVNDRWEASILEVVRGEQANVMMESQGGMYSDPPEGFEHLLIHSRLHLSIPEDDGTKECIDTQTMFTLYIDGSVQEPNMGTGPPLPWNYHCLYPGGIYEGWSHVLIPVGGDPVTIAFTKGETRYLAIAP